MILTVKGWCIWALILTFRHCESHPVSEKENDIFAFASYYGDRMVLQRGPQRAVIWGYGPRPGMNLSIYLDHKLESNTTVDEGSSWRFLLPPVTDTKSHTISVISSDSRGVGLQGVLFGDVWICSGQSNMQFTVSMGLNASEEIADAVNYPNIRVFTVNEETSDTRLSDLASVEEVWSIASPDAIGGKNWTYFSALCWLYGKRLYKNLNYPIGLVSSTWAGTPIECWSDITALKKCGISKTDKNNRKPTAPDAHSVLWNAMIYPLTNMTIYGVIWYQGEENADHPDSYKCSFPEMIQSWRQFFHLHSNLQTDTKFPFGFVQLSAWRNDSTISTGFTDIRWHQTADYGYVPNPKLPRVFMAATLDLPDYTSIWGSIHPRDKQDVADRLILSALNVAYNKPAGKYQGPFPTRFYQDQASQTILITYDDGMAEIEVINLNGFEVCCSIMKDLECNEKDSTWINAPITEFDKHSVTILYSGCVSPYVNSIRYAWRESPCPFKKCAVYSVENSLPAPPFIHSLQPWSKSTLYFKPFVDVLQSKTA